jgi:hypothetical protein
VSSEIRAKLVYQPQIAEPEEAAFLGYLHIVKMAFLVADCR